MCEALIWIKDKVPNGHPHHALNYRRGDVITVQDEGWRWSPAELNHPDWRVIRLPGVAASALEDLCRPETSVDGNVLKKRGRFFDMAVLPPGLSAKVNQGSVCVLTESETTDFMAARKSRQSAAVIG